MVGLFAFIALVILTPRALKQLQKIFDYYRRHVSPEAGQKRVDQLLGAASELDKFPNILPTEKVSGLSSATVLKKM